MPPPQAVRRRTTVTRAPRSRARLILATNSRRFVAKPRTQHPITRKGYATSVRQQSCQRLCNPQAAQLFKCRSANVRGRGARPLVLSLGGSRGILSFEKESIPLYPCSATGAAIPTALCAESKINIPRPSRGYFLDGRSPMLPATPHAALVRSDICIGLLPAARKRA